jgi:hypothetical protein
MKIRKLDAAGHQLVEAVNLFVSGASPVALHTLASAAYAILRDINEKRGGGGMIKDLHKLVGPDRAADLRYRMNRSQNFFKHADNDPDGEIEFNPEETPLPLFEAILKYRELTDHLPPQLAAFAAWFLLQNKTLMPKDTPFALMIHKIEAANLPSEREAFFREAVELLSEPAPTEGERDAPARGLCGA